jgi:pimeloyl-ACP methyl ester carboxylesterase
MSAIVMIHGLFGHLQVPEVHEALKPFEVHAPDLIGYGAHRNADTTALRLDDQVDHIIEFIETLDAERVHLLGHSVGGAVAMLVAHRRPELLVSLTSVEGNFTLKDAFWSGQIAQKDDAEVEAIIDGFRRDPSAWMGGAVDVQSELTDRLAREWLDNQPASTIKAQAGAVVKATGPETYLRDVQVVMESNLPIHLISGERSAAGWDAPFWANKLCASRFNIPNTGHLMMAEDPKAFAAAVTAGITNEGVSD